MCGEIYLKVMRDVVVVIVFVISIVIVVGVDVSRATHIYNNIIIHTRDSTENSLGKTIVVDFV